MADLVRGEHVVGVTTNPTIFSRAITTGDAYGRQVTELAARGVGVGEALRALTTFDVRWACDVLRDVYHSTDGVDGRVSIEVDPRLAHDTDATVTDAFLDGLERAPGRPRPVTHPLGGVVLRQPGRQRGRPTAGRHRTPQAEALRGRAAIANARLAYAHHEQVLSGPRWAALATAGARPQRPLWASTGVKDPAYPDTRYVADLVGPGVVNTMPEHTLRAVADHGEIVADSIHRHHDDARHVLEALHALGIDYNEVVQTLEGDAVAAFDASRTQLGNHLDGALRAAQPADTRS